ncbi:MAG: transglycosylase domain-containing protein [Candidatus Gracilibacteria bacterium]|jgi:membrane peptidoglycan carboxypeptidase
MLKKYLPHKEAGLFQKIFFWLIAGAVGLFMLGIITVAFAITILSIGLPNIKDIDTLAEAQSTEIFDRKGELLYTIHGEENREHIAYNDISPYLIDATVAIEDDKFWEHNGFDIWALGKVALHEVFGIGAARGGSTITQQYIKNAFLSAEKTYTRKAKELILSLRIERALTKKEILELYLNRIPYGNNAFGSQKAAEIYFGKSAKDLTLAESAILAALPQAPSKYNPFGNNKYSHLLKDFTEDELFYRKINAESDLEISEYIRGLIGQYVTIGTKEVYLAGRSDLVLKRMYDTGKITMDQRQKALNEIQNLQFILHQDTFAHPHFVLYIKQILEDKYGKDVVEQGGLKVYTTLDPDLQTYSEEVIKTQGEINAKNSGANNLASLTINAKTGEILAMVGSRDYFNEEIDGNVNVVLRPRQPGSSFKPIVYAQAFYNGYAPGNVIYDIPTKIGQDRPQDYDGKWLGQISLRTALGKSRNIPAIKAYFLAGEQDPVIDLATRMGITTLDKTHSYGYPLALGAGEIPLIEMVTAYGVFANDGKKPNLTAILKVKNANGDVLEEWTDNSKKTFEQVLDPQIAYLINSILSDKNASIGMNLYVDGKINAAKTGTSTKENKKEAGGAVRPSDGWTIGYTPTIVTGVWMGNTDGTGMAFSAEAYNGAAPVFKKIMTKALENIPNEEFPKPEGIKEVKISKASGLLPGKNTPESMITTEIFPSFSIPTEVESLFYKVEIDKITGKLATQYTPADAIQVVTYQNYKPIADMLDWANEIKQYYQNKKSTEGEETEGILSLADVQIGTPPTEYDNVHTEQTALKAPTISITSPTSQSTLPQGEIKIDVMIESKNGVKTIEYYIDDEKKYFTSTAPYTGNLNISKFFPAGSRHIIVAKVIDSLGYSAQSAIEIKVEAEK